MEFTALLDTQSQTERLHRIFSKMPEQTWNKLRL